MESALIIGVIKESDPGETRVAATPATVQQLRKLGYSVVVEPDAGVLASYNDAAYTEAGASVGDAFDADVVLGVNPPSIEQRDRLRDGTTLVSILRPALDADLVADLSYRPITALAMDAVPRISRAQSMDVLSSMANVAGYRAVVEAANEFGRMFPGQVTAAGKVAPAKILVVGAGVAGLAAIGAAGSMGAVVRATDPRPEVAEHVRSLGGEYLSIESPEVEVSATGYAKEMGDDYKVREAELYAAQCQDVDIVITTALIPGRPAPRIITAEMVASMAPGSVIVDMAAANGGNIEGSRAGEKVVTPNGVTILGYTDLAGRLPAQASQLYATNIVNLLKLLTPERDGQLVIDLDDVVQRSMMVVRYVDGDSECTWPPPPVEVSAAPATAPAPAPEKPKKTTPSGITERGRQLAVGVAAAALFALIAVSPERLQGLLTVFALAIVIGFYVIGNVARALHTPLMSVTNAISGIIVVGALVQIGFENPLITALAFFATLLASINIFGGFAVTGRMLSMFSRS